MHDECHVITFMDAVEKIYRWGRAGKITIYGKLSYGVYTRLDYEVLDICGLLPPGFEFFGNCDPAQHESRPYKEGVYKFERDLEWMNSPHALTIFKAKMIKRDERKKNERRDMVHKERAKRAG